MNDLSRRSLLAHSAMGLVAAPLVADAATAAAVSPGVQELDRCRNGWGTKLSKYSWTVATQPGTDRKEFQQFVLRDLAMATAKKVPGATRVAVTCQEVDAFSSGLVNIGGSDRPIDAIIEVTTSQPYAPVKAANAHLTANTGFVQGWHVHPTTIFDEIVPVPLGARSLGTRICIFLQRLDGTTPEHYDINWYKHAGHLDGREADTDQTRAFNKRILSTRERGEHYFQNRVLEQLTPTQWVIAGYTDLGPRLAPTGPVERYRRGNGEEIFEEWPPRMVQGYQYVLRA